MQAILACIINSQDVQHKDVYYASAWKWPAKNRRYRFNKIVHRSTNKSSSSKKKCVVANLFASSERNLGEDRCSL